MTICSERAVVLDLDGLMADSEPLAMWAWNQVLARYGHRLDKDAFRQIAGLRVVDSARLICRRFGLPISPEAALAERERRFLEAVPTRLRARSGLGNLLDALDALGTPLAVATSGHRRYVALALQALGIEGRFRALAAGDEVVHGKPAPDVYRLAAERLGVEPRCCLALEDSCLGLQSALAAGMTCLAVPTECTQGSDFAGAYMVVPSLDEAGALAVEHVERGLEAADVRYVAAGGVVAVDDDRVLLLRRPSRDEVRLPKGHVDPGETVQQTALRETREESGYLGLALQDDLGAQINTFDHGEQHVLRLERFFLMTLSDPGAPPATAEEQFCPVWLSWDAALDGLTFELEREWVRRARVAWGQYKGRREEEER